MEQLFSQQVDLRFAGNQLQTQFIVFLLTGVAAGVEGPDFFFQLAQLALHLLLLECADQRGFTDFTIAQARFQKSQTLELMEALAQLLARAGTA